MGLVQYIEGKAFEDEVRRSWSVIPDSWLLRITDGKKTGPRPADFIAITNKCNFLIEAKKREALTFNRYTVETHQIKSLLDFQCSPHLISKSKRFYPLHTRKLCHFHNV